MNDPEKCQNYDGIISSKVRICCGGRRKEFTYYACKLHGRVRKDYCVLDCKDFVAKVEDNESDDSEVVPDEGLS